MGFKNGSAVKNFADGLDTHFIFSSTLSAAPDDTTKSDAGAGLSVNTANLIATIAGSGAAEENIYNPNDGLFSTANNLVLKYTRVVALAPTFKIYADSVLVKTITYTSSTGDIFLLLGFGGVPIKNLRITVTNGTAGAPSALYGRLTKFRYK